MKNNQDAVGLLYPIAVQSYDTALRRIDAKDTLLAKLFGACIAVFIGAIYKSTTTQELDLSSLWFYGISILFFGQIVALGYGRFKGDMDILSPRALVDHYMEQEANKIKESVILYSKDSFLINQDQINRKLWCALGVAITIVIQACLYLGWAVSA